ncbi:MAG: homoserine O-acetyltransferase [Sphingobacteriales bacterium]|nr:homoserine O-acetyltransferase [Sphingobacteriales bacterium]
MDYFHYQHRFELESGQSLPEITVAYHTYGSLNADKSNVIWVCHALTANSDVATWWDGVVGDNHVVDPKKYFIVCANILGSCYGSSGPLSIDPATQKPYYSTFPQITIRDMVKAHILLRQHLGIEKIFLMMGGSMGGYQALEWTVMEKEVINRLFILATSPTESAWGIAIHTAQRLAIEADSTYKDHTTEAGKKGLKAARAIGMLTYRNYGIMVKHQTDTDTEKLDNYRAASYIDYQGDKLVQRFNAYVYWLLTKSMDSHHLGRGRGGKVEAVLQSIQQKTLIIGISSDILCPLIEQKFIANNLPDATLIEIDSTYGHDGFMVESKIISQHLAEWLGDPPFLLGYGATI